MVIDMKKDKLVIMDWGGVVESHSEESYLAHNVVKRIGAVHNGTVTT